MYNKHSGRAWSAWSPWIKCTQQRLALSSSLDEIFSFLLLLFLFSLFPSFFPFLYFVSFLFFLSFFLYFWVRLVLQRTWEAALRDTRNRVRQAPSCIPARRPEVSAGQSCLTMSTQGEVVPATCPEIRLTLSRERVGWRSSLVGNWGT